MTHNLSQMCENKQTLIPFLNVGVAAGGGNSRIMYKQTETNNINLRYGVSAGEETDSDDTLTQN